MRSLSHLATAGLLFGCTQTALASESAEIKAAQEVFERFIALGQASDPAMADLYTDEAIISTRRDGEDLTMSGEQYKAMMLEVMDPDQPPSDVDTFEKVRFKLKDGGVRVTALRHSALKCTKDKSFYLQLAPVEGEWRIVEEHSTTTALSQCEANPALAKKLAAMSEGLQPHLPLQLDEETRLDKVSVQGVALTYQQTLVNLTAASVDLQELRPLLYGLAVNSGCAAPEMRALMDSGATLRYVFSDQGGVELLDAVLTSARCP